MADSTKGKRRTMQVQATLGFCPKCGGVWLAFKGDKSKSCAKCKLTGEDSNVDPTRPTRLHERRFGIW